MNTKHKHISKSRTASGRDGGIYDVMLSGVHRVRKVSSLRVWERWYIGHLGERRTTMYGSAFVANEIAQKALNHVNRFVTEEVLITARNRTAFNGGDVRYILKYVRGEKKPDQVHSDIVGDLLDDGNFSSTLLGALLRDWSGFAAVESVFSRSFAKKISVPEGHLEAFFAFISRRHTYGNMMPSRAVVAWLKHTVDGRWKHRQYGASITRRVHEGFPSIIAFAETWMNKRSGVQENEEDVRSILADLLNQMIENNRHDGKQELPLRMEFYRRRIARTTSSIKERNGDRYRDFDPGFIKESRHRDIQGTGKRKNTVEGILSHRFLDFTLMNVDASFALVVLRYVEENSAKSKARAASETVPYGSENRAYGARRSLMSLSVKSIRRQRGRAHDPFTFRRLPFASLAYALSDRGNDPFSTMDMETEYDVALGIGRQVSTDFTNMIAQGCGNGVPMSMNHMVAANEVIRLVDYVTYRRIYRPAIRRKMLASSLHYMNRGAAGILTLRMLELVANSRMHSDAVFGIMRINLDLFLAGRPGHYSRKMVPGNVKPDIPCINDAIFRTLANYNMFDGSGMIMRSDMMLEHNGSTAELKKEIVAASLYRPNISNGAICRSNVSYYRTHEFFMKRHRDMLYNIRGGHGHGQGESLSVKASELAVCMGMRNPFYWNLWRKRRTLATVCNESLDFALFVCRMIMWSTHTARGMCGYETQGYMWVPDLSMKTASDRRLNAAHRGIRKWNAETDLPSIPVDDSEAINRELKATEEMEHGLKMEMMKKMSGNMHLSR